jgi:hypothetical protein
MNTAEIATHKHIARVRQLLGQFACEMIARGDCHDQSKFHPIEAGPLQAMQDIIDREGQAPYGSEEYNRRTALLGEMWTHHVARNSHHPEHYPNGVAGMDLHDLVEMFCDWKAASERGEEPAMAITACVEKYGIADPLASILRNTADRNGWRYK